MRAELEDLVEGMSRHGGVCMSGDLVSMRAHDEARSLDDPSMVPELIEAYQASADGTRRRVLVRLIGRIGERTLSDLCLEALLGILRVEKDRFVLAEALHRFRELPKPEGTDLAPVFARFEDRDRLTRQGALLALERARSAEAERRILAHLVATPDERDRFYCVAVLMSIGTEAALPALQRALRSGRKDVRFAANEAIALIAERSSKASL